MAFDVSKFLALTVLIAGTGAACSDDKEDPDNSGGQSAAGAPDTGKGGAPEPGGSSSGNGGAHLGGEGGSLEGGTGTGTGAIGGGESTGGAGGSGGEGGSSGEKSVEPCLSNALLMGEGGAGGAGALDVDPSLEGLCMDFFNLVCPGSEDLAPAYTVCEGVKQKGLTVVALDVAECLTALNETDQCDAAAAAACFDDLVGKACAVPDSTAPCEAIHASCTDEPVTVAACKKVADLIAPEMYGDITDCMDPAAESGVWDDVVETKCEDRLVACARHLFQ